MNGRRSRRNHQLTLAGRAVTAGEMPGALPAPNAQPSGLWLAVRTDPAALYPSLSPLAWPALAVLPAAAILVAALPAVLAPPPPIVRSGAAA